MATQIPLCRLTHVLNCECLPTQTMLSMHGARCQFVDRHAACLIGWIVGRARCAGHGGHGGISGGRRQRRRRRGGVVDRRTAHGARCAGQGVAQEACVARRRRIHVVHLLESLSMDVRDGTNPDAHASQSCEKRELPPSSGRPLRVTVEQHANVPHFRHPLSRTHMLSVACAAVRSAIVPLRRFVCTVSASATPIARNRGVLSNAA